MTSLAVLFLAILLVVVVAMILKAIKAAVVSSVPLGISFHETDPSAYPAADFTRLERYTTEFSALGYAHIGDYALSARAGTIHPGFARMFIHPLDGTYAEVNQLFPAGHPAVPLRCVIGTLFGDGWSAATTDRDPDGGIYLLRQPRSVWQSIAGAGVAELVRQHTELCARVEREARVRKIGNTSRDMLFRREDELAIERRNKLLATSPVTMLATVLLFPYRPKYKWMGDLRRYNSLQTHV